MEPTIDTISTVSNVPTRDNCSCIYQDPCKGTEEPLLESDDNINYIPVRYGSGCNTNTIVLALIETPPLLSKRNIMDLMSRLKTPVAKRSYVNEILENDTVHRYTALEFIFQDWFTRRSSTATLETLILHFRICNLNSHADALKKRFYENGIYDKNITSPGPIENSYRSTTSYRLKYKDDEENNDLNYLRRKPKRDKETPAVKNRCLCFLILSCSLALLFGCIFFYSTRIFFLNNSFPEVENTTKNQPSTPVSFTVVPPNFIEENDINRDKRHLSKNCEGLELKRSIIVDSFETLENELKSVTHCDLLSIVINSNNSEVWSRKLDLLQEYNIISISFAGSIYIETVYEIIRHSANLVYLHINETSDIVHFTTTKISDKNSDLPADCRIELAYLQHFRFSSFTQSGIIMEMMMTCVKMNLIAFDFDGSISDKRAYQIFHLIQANRKTLQEIRISGLYETNFFVIPFDKSMNSLKLLNIKAYNNFSDLESNVVISSQFCSLFPELNEIKLDIPVQLQHIKMLQSCLKLRRIDVTINIYLPHTAIDVINSIENFPSTKSLVITILFMNGCPNSTVFYDNRFRIHELKVSYLRFCSNCVINPQRQTHCMSK